MSEKDEKEQLKVKTINRRQFITGTATAAGAVALTSVLGGCGGSSSAAVPQTVSAHNIVSGAWKFGVMADTQWTNPPGDDGFNPNTAAMAIANQIQQQFINNKVGFVVHVGDLCDNANMGTSATPSPGGVSVETGSNAGTVTSSSSWTTSTNAPDASTQPSLAGEDTRALYVQALYNAGIGFFPLRGNHDDDQPPNGAIGALIAKEFTRIYPQTQNGNHNATPADIFNSFASGDYWVPKDNANVSYAAQSGSPFTMGSNFSSPDPWGDGGLKGLSYSFDYNNVRCILLDQFVPTTNNSNYSMQNTIGSQQSWISSQLAGRASGSHAIVFAHKGLLTCNHADNLFSYASGSNASPAYNASAQNAFFSSLASNGVRLYINGHDHMYDRSIVTSPDGTSSVMQIIAQSDSSKFYPPQGSLANTTTVPAGSSVDLYFNNNATSASAAPKYVNGAAPSGAVARRQVVSQELFTVGYYIVTVNGPLVNVDYYAATVYPYPIDTSEQIINTTPGLNFVKRETFGYSLNGKQFIVAQGGAYNVVQDGSSGGTTAAILGGVNNSKAQDACGLACVKAVNTGWLSASNSVSDILMLWGINPYTPSTQADMYSYPDIYTLSMKAPSGSLNSGFAICTQDANGNWTNAVNLNSGGTKNFVNGPWNSSYGLGTYGYDPTTNSVWAVLNYTALFAIATPVS